MSRISELYALQQIDSGLQSRVARMRQIDEQMVDGPQLIAARAAHSEASAHLAAEQAYLKRTTHEADEVSSRQKAQEKRLYDGSIKNPKELGQVQEEVEHLKARLRETEDLVLDTMEAVETSEEALRARQEELDQVAREWEQYQAGLTEEKDTLLSQAKVLQVKRQRAVATLPWADLQVYERLRRSKGAMAVAPVQGGLCGGCHVGVPAHVLRLARASSEFVECPSCGRLLYPVGEVKYEEFNHDLDNIDR